MSAQSNHTDRDYDKGYVPDYSPNYDYNTPDYTASVGSNENDAINPDEAVNTATSYLQNSFETMQEFVEKIAAQQRSIDAMLTEAHVEAEGLESRLAFLKSVDTALMSKLQDLQKVREAAYKVNQLFSESMTETKNPNTSAEEDYALTRQSLMNGERRYRPLSDNPQA